MLHPSDPQLDAFRGAVRSSEEWAPLFELLQQFLFELLHNHSLPIHLCGGRITGVECALVGQNCDIESLIVTFCMCNVTFAFRGAVRSGRDQPQSNG